MRRWAELGSVSAEQTRALLRQFAPAIEAGVRSFTVGGARVGLDRDDLRQLARLAVIDAALSHDERASLGHWVRKTIRWRLTEALEDHAPVEEPLDEPQSVVNGQNPEEMLARVFIARWVRLAVDGLDVRQRTILACRLEGESMREVAASLGISAARVHEETHRAYKRLRRQARRDRLDVGDLDS